MEQLLKITTIPLEYQLKIENSRLEYKSSTANLEMSRTHGKLSIENRPAKLNLDTYEARNSVVPTLKRSISQVAERGLPDRTAGNRTICTGGTTIVESRKWRRYTRTDFQATRSNAYRGIPAWIYSIRSRRHFLSGAKLDAQL